LIQSLKKRGYTYDKLIGKGGFARVYLIHSQQCDEDFVLKENIGGDNHSQYKNTELQTLQKLIHPNVIKIYESFCSNSNQCLILEYCPSGSLDTILKEKGPLKPPLLFDWAKEILQAIQYIHQQGFAHRDIKPANILIDKHGHPKVADFGISEEAALNKLEQNYSGSFAFMAPELLNHAPFDPKLTDIWALGVTFYYMATGHCPWTMDNKLKIQLQINCGAYQTMDDVDHLFCRVIASMIAVESKSRIKILDLLSCPFFQTTSSSIKRQTNPQCFFTSPTINQQFDVESQANEQENKDAKKFISSTFASFGYQQRAYQNTLKRRFSNLTAGRKHNPLATLQGVHTKCSHNVGNELKKNGIILSQNNE
jgi:serine/threonine protein kinase